MNLKSKPPSNKQINLADKIAKVLEIDFPRGDYDFTAHSYWLFINKHYKEFKEVMENPILPLDAYDDDIFYGQEFGLWEY